MVEIYGLEVVCLLVGLIVAEMLFADVEEARLYLDGPGAPKVEVLLSYDSRVTDAKDYFLPLSELRERWAMAGTDRVTINIWGVDVADLPCCDKTYHVAWAKVAIVRLLGPCRRVTHIAWCDSDACPALDLSSQHKSPHRRYLDATIAMPSLKSVFQRASSPNVKFLGY